jgi:biopolymer transport protein ExbD
MNNDDAGFRRHVVHVVNSGTALAVAAIIAIGGILIWGYRTNTALEREITRLRGDTQTLTGLQRENRRLARLVSEAEELKRELAELPVLRATLLPPAEPPASGTASITVTAAGTIQWGNEDVTSSEFIRRLSDFRAQYPAADSSVLVRASGVSLSAVAYLLDEVRKAQITLIVVEGEPKADASSAAWF